MEQLIENVIVHMSGKLEKIDCDFSFLVVWVFFF